MAITPLTGFKAFTFDGEVSTDYGVAILGEGVFNAPERDVEMITIPGRSGQFALDNGRFENIEVTYPANLIANSAADFADALSDFRNMLCSKKGYVRLQDDYHPNEYRMAVYKEGLEVNEKVLRAGEFKITFDCKPQRWLTSGESAVTIANSGDTITNPTLFDSSPMLEVYGYGTVSFNNYDIEILSDELGEIKISDTADFSSGTSSRTYAITIDTSNLVSGDSIYVIGSGMLQCSVYNLEGSKFRNASATSTSGVISTNIVQAGNFVRFQINPDFSTGFVYGTASTITCSATFQYYKANGVTYTTETISGSYAYDGGSTLTITVTRTGVLMQNTKRASESCTMPALYGNSSKIITPAPVYIDCDLGEAYGYESGELVSYNNIVAIPADLPKLASGANAITYDNTITNLKITPRWWKV